METENETNREPLWLTVLSWVGGIVTVAFIGLMLWPYAPAAVAFLRDDVLMPVVQAIVGAARLVGWSR
jgi:hypothetical protein